VNITQPRLLAVILAILSTTVIVRGQTAKSAAATLNGTAWQLVQIQSMDDKVVTPPDRSHFTLAFGADGYVSVRADCNRGRGTWKSSAPAELLVGPLALTRAMCPAASLHDRFVRDLGLVRSYVVKDGHLFLSLMADGGIYEFEPMPKPAAKGAKPDR
jgi:para-nitrobenzyl esterase